MSWRFAISTLHAKLLLAFGFIVLLPLAVIGYLDYRAMRSALTDAAYRSLFVAASQTAERVDDFFEATTSMVGTEAQLQRLRTYLSTPLDERARMEPLVLDLLRNFTQRDPSATVSYALLDMRGRNLLDTQRENIGADESAHHYFTIAMRTGVPYASRVEFSPDGNAYITFSSVVRNNAGEFIGVLRGRFRAAVLQRIISDQTGLLGERSFPVLVNQDYVLLAHGFLVPDELSRRLGRSLFPLDPERAVALQREQRLPRDAIETLVVDMPGVIEGLAKVDSDSPYFMARIPLVEGETQAAAVASMRAQPWRVAYFQPRDVFLEPVLANTRHTALIAVAILAIAAAAAIGVAQWLTFPLRRLTLVAREVADGNLDARADVSSRDEIGALARSFTFMTERLNQTLQGLRRSEEKFRNIHENALEGICQVGLDGELLSVNPAMARLLGYTSTAELLAARNIIHFYVEPKERATLVAALMKHGAISCWEVEFRRRDDKHIWVSISSRLVPRQGDRPAFLESFVTDVTQRRQAEARIRHLAQHDVLTGLPNRTLFRDRIASAVVQARREQRMVAVMFIDLDRFKDINDSLGHQVGDQLLRATARRLQACLREGDSVTRLGGDEFAICLPMIENSESVALVAHKILEAMTEPLIADGQALHVTGSIGISLYPTDGDNADTLLRASDAAMYHAKDTGRGNYQFFTAVLNDAARKRLAIANRLHHAVERGEFTLHYQPQVELASNRIFAVEALIRWRQPEFGLVQPAEFIHVAEETGLIVSMGEWVLRRACEQLRRWHDAGYSELRMAVNLSPQQFHRLGLAEFVAGVLRDTRLSAHSLDLELTESVLMMHNAENVAVLEQLAAMGVQLTLDDFGTGYSSLSYLQRFPIHTIKIDRSFVSDIERDPNHVAIVKAMLAMAHGLKLNVIAEGTETAGQVKFLQENGCPAVQGFFYSRPVPAAVLDDLLNRDSGRLAMPLPR